MRCKRGDGATQHYLSDEHLACAEHLSSSATMLEKNGPIDAVGAAFREDTDLLDRVVSVDSDPHCRTALPR